MMTSTSPPASNLPVSLRARLPCGPNAIPAEMFLRDQMERRLALSGCRPVYRIDGGDMLVADPEPFDRIDQICVDTLARTLGVRVWLHGGDVCRPTEIADAGELGRYFHDARHRGRPWIEVVPLPDGRAIAGPLTGPPTADDIARVAPPWMPAELAGRMLPE